MEDIHGEHEQFKGRIIFMSMFNDIFWREKEIEEKCKVMLTKLRLMLSDFLAVMGHSWDLDPNRNGTEHYSDKPDGIWTKLLRR